MILGLLSIVFSGFHKSRLMSIEEAVIFKPSIDLMSEPTENSSVSFVLHEGTKVEVIDALGTWSKIKIVNGSEGWVENSSLRMLN